MKTTIEEARSKAPSFAALGHDDVLLDCPHCLTPTPVTRMLATFSPGLPDHTPVCPDCVCPRFLGRAVDCGTLVPCAA